MPKAQALDIPGRESQPGRRRQDHTAPVLLEFSGRAPVIRKFLNAEGGRLVADEIGDGPPHGIVSPRGWADASCLGRHGAAARGNRLALHQHGPARAMARATGAPRDRIASSITQPMPAPSQRFWAWNPARSRWRSARRWAGCHRFWHRVTAPTASRASGRSSWWISCRRLDPRGCREDPGLHARPCP